MDEFYDLRDSVSPSVYQAMQTYFSNMMEKWNEECCKYNNCLLYTYRARLEWVF